MTTPIRFGGIASGLDTDAIISKLMQVERAPVNKLSQQKQLLMWKRDAYREVNTMLTSFRIVTDKLRFSAAYSKQLASSSNTSVVNTTATSSATSGSYTVRVESLATTALVVGEKKDVNTAVDKISIAADVNISINGTPLTISAGSTYDTVMKQINSSGAGVNISYDSINKRFMLSSKATGSGASISINDSSVSAMTEIFNIKPNNANEITDSGSKAIVTVNGTQLEMDNNSFEFNGVKFELKGVSTSDVSVTVSRDTQNIASQIKEFVNQYNNLVDKINASTTAKPERSYLPLTDEEKKEMTEKQIELWEGKAKTGLLYRDTILKDVLFTTHNSLIGKVKGLPDELNTLSDIGLNFKKYSNGNLSDLGKIEIDEQKLLDAINNNPDGVMNLFTKTSQLDPQAKGYKEEIGFAERLYNDLDTQIKKIIKKIGSGMISDVMDNSQFGEQLRIMNDKMDTYERRMLLVENRYYKQFSAMEKAIQKLNSQGSWLSQQLGTGSY
ncbi:flagellar filament capping protein FliD [Paenibacillus sp. FSL K6-1566]|uniref:flagellar filament capping protein FliD n=1 Tax=Paenibacillus TaxID=44249 RepID=UPI00203F6B0F|nr:flagellar filament capping protein FliD [Paenibacillus lactis]MCM3493474.1 flagellar filament capping protein FliD [Paenibacillus lactis]